jgi:hypothetical protein
VDEQEEATMSLRKDARKSGRIAVRGPRIAVKSPLKKKEPVPKISKGSRQIKSDLKARTLAQATKAEIGLVSEKQDKQALRDSLAATEKYKKAESAKNELIEVYLSRVSFHPELPRPRLIFRDSMKKHVVEVPVNVIEAGMVASLEFQSLPPVTPHRFSYLLLESLGIKIQRCEFAEVVGREIYVQLILEGHPKLDKIKVKAEEIISLCLFLNIRFYVSREFLKQANDMTIATELDAQLPEIQNPILRQARRGAIL